MYVRCWCTMTQILTLVLSLPGSGTPRRSNWPHLMFFFSFICSFMECLTPSTILPLYRYTSYLYIPPLFWWNLSYYCLQKSSSTMNSNLYLNLFNRKSLFSRSIFLLGNTTKIPSFFESHKVSNYFQSHRPCTPNSYSHHSVLWPGLV